jgi:hypothetical protein
MNGCIAACCTSILPSFAADSPGKMIEAFRDEAATRFETANPRRRFGSTCSDLVTLPPMVGRSGQGDTPAPRMMRIL